MIKAIKYGFYVIFLGLYLFGIMHADDYTNASHTCAIEKGDWRYNKQIFHWNENGECCTHILSEDNKMVVSCG